MEEFPKIISVDDHVVEPPNLWQDRVPAAMKERAPKVVFAPKGDVSFVGGKLTVSMGEPGSGPDVAWWIYEDLKRPLMRLDASVGYDRDEVDLRLVGYDQMRTGAYSVKERLEDMDANWTESQMCFPTFPRFCGQTFLDAQDKDVALECVKAYNDFQVEEWCGDADGRLIPLIIVPLWDAELAAQEVRRNAARGVRATCFSEIPPYLNLPSIHTDYWEPFFRACEETGTVINMHIGSSSKMPSTSADAPAAVGSTLTFGNAMSSMTDWLFSGWLAKLPTLKLASIENGAMWVPDLLRNLKDAYGKMPFAFQRHPVEQFTEQVWVAPYYEDDMDRLKDAIGVDRLLFGSDFPHTEGLPEPTLFVKDIPGFDQAEVRAVMRDNVLELLGV